MVTADQIRSLLGAAADTQVAKDLEVHFESLRKRRDPLYLDLSDLDRILHWKLRGQYGRQQNLRSKNTESIVRTATHAAFAMQHQDPDYEVELKIAMLCGIRGVGVPVASAILRRRI